MSPRPPIVFHPSRVWTGVLSGIFLITVSSCAKKGPDPDDVPVGPPAGQSRVVVEIGQPVVKLKPEEIAAIGVQTAVVKKSTHRSTLPAFGIVLDPQPLAAAASAATDAQSQLTKAKTALGVSGAEYERAKRLHENQQNLSMKEFETAQGAWRSDQAVAAAAESSFRLAQTTLSQQWGNVLTRWLVENPPQIERILNGEDVLLRIALPEGSSVATSAPARIHLSNGDWEDAALVSPTRQASPEFQAPGYFYLAKSAEGLLPGMNVEVLLPGATSATHPGGSDIPAEAALHWQGRRWIYLQTAPGIFARRDISSGEPDGNGGYFVPDLESGTVVVRGAPALLSEEFKPGPSG